MNLEQAMTANNFEHVGTKNADGTPMRCRRNGKTKTWKRNPERFRIPVKYGLYGYFYLDSEYMATGHLHDPNQWVVA